MITKYLHNMKQKIPTLMLGIAAMLASCSQNDEVLQSHNNTSELQTVTITATLEDGMTTRATPNTSEADDAVNRCFMEVAETSMGQTTPTYSLQNASSNNGSFSFTINLNPNSEYTFYFWADGGSSYYTVGSDLENITLSTNAEAPGIAYRGTTTWNETITGQRINVTLTHAVAKVSLHTTSDVEEGAVVKMTVPSYTAYNARTGSAITGTGINPTPYSYSYTLPNDIDGAASPGSFVCSAYSIMPSSGEAVNITLQYDDQPEALQTSIPLAPNRNTRLVGDLFNLGTTQITFDVSTDGRWNDQDTNFQ